MQKILSICAALLIATACSFAIAEEKESRQAVPQSAQTTAPPQMSEIPTMQAQGKRISALMEKIQTVTDPVERKRMLAEATCPQ